MGQKAINPNDMNQPVYYDAASQQYYTVNREPFAFKDKSTGQPVSATDMPMINPLSNLLYAMGFGGGNSTRSYLNNAPIQNQIISAQQTYPSVNQMFPALGANNILNNSLLAPTDIIDNSGAARFLAPSTSKGK